MTLAISPVFAGTIVAANIDDCTVPPGNYVASSLGAGLDQLVFTVGAGQVTASYTIQDASSTGRAMAYWLDRTNATIFCRGDSLSLSYQSRLHALSVQGQWNAVRQGMDIQGSYCGLPSSSRIALKGALLMAAVVGMAYEGWYVHTHLDDVRLLARGLRYAQQADSQIFAHPMVSRLSEAVGVNAAGTGMWVWRSMVKEYFFTTHLYDFTLPIAATLASFVVGGTLSRCGTYALSGFGTLMDEVTDMGSCRIPDGLYQGQIRDHPFELWRVAVSLAQGTLKKISITSIAESGNRTMTVHPNRFHCRGDQLSVEWLQSSPDSSTGKLVLFYGDKGTLEGSGVVVPAQGWLWRSDPVVMARIRLAQ